MRNVKRILALLLATAVELAIVLTWRSRYLTVAFMVVNLLAGSIYKITLWYELIELLRNEYGELYEEHKEDLTGILAPPSLIIFGLYQEKPDKRLRSELNFNVLSGVWLFMLEGALFSFLGPPRA